MADAHIAAAGGNHNCASRLVQEWLLFGLTETALQDYRN